MWLHCVGWHDRNMWSNFSLNLYQLTSLERMTKRVICLCSHFHWEENMMKQCILPEHVKDLSYVRWFPVFSLSSRNETQRGFLGVTYEGRSQPYVTNNRQQGEAPNWPRSWFTCDTATCSPPRVTSQHSNLPVIQTWRELLFVSYKKNAFYSCPWSWKAQPRPLIIRGVEVPAEDVVVYSLNPEATRAPQNWIFILELIWSPLWELRFLPNNFWSTCPS